MHGLVAAPTGPVPVSVAQGVLTTWVTWIDGYGNVQLAGEGAAWEQLGVAPGATGLVELDLDPAPADGRPGRKPARQWEHSALVRPVSSFASLDPGELGLVIDAHGRHALVLDRASAASALGIPGPGAVVRARVRDGDR